MIFYRWPATYLPNLELLYMPMVKYIPVNANKRPIVSIVALCQSKYDNTRVYNVRCFRLFVRRSLTLCSGKSCLTQINYMPTAQNRFHNYTNHFNSNWTLCAYSLTLKSHGVTDWRSFLNIVYSQTVIMLCTISSKTTLKPNITLDNALIRKDLFRNL